MVDVIKENLYNLIHFISYDCYRNNSSRIEPIYNVDQIKKRYDNGEKLTYSFFYGGYYSQWHPSKLRINDISYCNNEQFMMAKKADYFGDVKSYNKIMSETDPSIIKAIGRKVCGFTDEKWDLIKYTVVFIANFAKFTQNEKMKNYLLNDNNDVIVEASPTDHVWGIKMGYDEKDKENPHCWKGQNLLGFAIMHVRDILRKENIKN